MSKHFIYMASPYSHKNIDVMRVRYLKACHAAAELMGLGFTVFAPIAHSHPIAGYLDAALRTDFDFWMLQDLPILRSASELVVVTLEGWEESRGVTREIELAKELGLPTRFYEQGRGFA
jgi:hypothetical protein